jgi:hypothetical protein
MKRKLNVKKKVILAEQVSVILQNNNAMKTLTLSKQERPWLSYKFHALLENIKLKKLYLILELV